MLPYDPPTLPFSVDMETPAVLRKLASAHRFLAELKGVSQTIPNVNILINTLSLQEARKSSEVENIITTQDEMFQADIFEDFPNAAAKEVSSYSHALQKGFVLLKKQGMLTTNDIISMHCELGCSIPGMRKLPGTDLKNKQTGETIYVPPQEHEKIVSLMTNLERFMNDDSLSAADPLVKMAMIHYQFETIHPFHDGNGRTGRIINVLYLVLKQLLTIPVLYLSRYIITHKNEYYRLLQEVRDGGMHEAWVLFMLDGIESTSRETILIIESIRTLMLDYKHRIRAQHKFYSQDLLNDLFRHPYTKIEFIEKDLNVSRITATKYLETLVNDGYLEKRKYGRDNFYINTPLVSIFLKSDSDKDR
ncbi:MAG: Fic family protein [Spirochaetes bacterium]|nr:Fic family protein [Spirochaetota bacterium]